MAVMGCVVNGPGESKAANIGISLPGTGESPNCPIYVDGQHVTTLRGTYDELAAAFQKLVDEYVEKNYPATQLRTRRASARRTIGSLKAADYFATFRIVRMTLPSGCPSTCATARTT